MQRCEHVFHVQRARYIRSIILMWNYYSCLYNVHWIAAFLVAQIVCNGNLIVEFMTLTRPNGWSTNDRKIHPDRKHLVRTHLMACNYRRGRVVSWWQFAVYFICVTSCWETVVMRIHKIGTHSSHAIVWAESHACLVCPDDKSKIMTTTTTLFGVSRFVIKVKALFPRAFTSNEYSIVQPNFKTLHIEFQYSPRRDFTQSK